MTELISPVHSVRIVSRLDMRTLPLANLVARISVSASALAIMLWGVLYLFPIGDYLAPYILLIAWYSGPLGAALAIPVFLYTLVRTRRIPMIAGIAVATGIFAVTLNYWFMSHYW